MKTATLFVTLALLAADKAPPEPMSKEEAQAKVRATLNGTGSAIDACNARYARENPDKKGQATVKVMLSDAGTVSKTDVETGLVGARHLRLCLETVAKGWRFPPPASPNQTFSLSIPVGPGAKFYVPGPNEKPKAADGPKREGHLTFLPNFNFRGPAQ